MILNNKLTLRYCVLLILLLLIAIFSKEIIYENLDVSNNNTLQDYLDGYKGAVDTKHYSTDYSPDKDVIESQETDGYICMARYNILLEAYIQSLNNLNSLNKNPNMGNALFPLTEHAQSIEGVSTEDAEKSANCPKTYSVSDANFFKNVAYDEHYINWLNINILRHFGNHSCNFSCSKFLQKNLHDSNSFDIHNDVSPSLVSLHHLGFYDSSSLNLPASAKEGEGDFEVHTLANSSLKEFYIQTVERLYKEYQAPRRKYFGVGLVNDVYKVWLTRDNGVLGLNKLIQGCAILDGGTDSEIQDVSAMINPNVKDLIFTPSSMADELRSINYIKPDYFVNILKLLPRSENEISVFGFFV